MKNSWGDLWDEPCGLSDCDSVTWTDAPVVTDVLVFPSSVVVEMWEGVSSDPDFHPQAFDRLCGESGRYKL